MKESQSHIFSYFCSPFSFFLFSYFFILHFWRLKLTTAVWATGMRSGRTCSKSIHCWPEPYANQRGELVVAFWQALFTVHLLRKRKINRKKKIYRKLFYLFYLLYFFKGAIFVSFLSIHPESINHSVGYYMYLYTQRERESASYIAVDWRLGVRLCTTV
jgi:hypothetical protein